MKAAPDGNSPLKIKTARALFWSGLNQVALQGVQLIVAIVLARLLLPSDFGLVAMLAVFTSLAQIFVDSGFSAALVQRRNLSRTDTSTVFYFNIIAGAGLAVVLGMAAPCIAAFYAQPLLVPLMRVLALNLIINAFGVVQTSLLTKQLEFRTLTVAVVPTVVFGGVVGAVMALHGFGVWSLVVQSLVSNAARTVLLWFATDWRPSWVFSLTALRSMFSFGSRLLASGVMFTFVDNLHAIVIGRLFAATELGLYTQARRFQNAPSGGLSAILGRVTFPVFAQVQHDDDRLRRGVRKIITTSVFVNFPLMVGLAACAKPLVSLLLTEKWLPCVPYIQLLCILGLIHPLHVINLQLLKAKGRSDLFLRLEIIKNALVIAGIAVSWPFGVLGLICGQVVVGFLCLYLNCYYTGKIIGYMFADQVRDLLPYLAAAVGMGLLVFCVTWLEIEGVALLLALQVIVGSAVYFAACYLLKLTALTDTFALVRRSLV